MEININTHKPICSPSRGTASRSIQWSTPTTLARLTRLAPDLQVLIVAQTVGIKGPMFIEYKK